MGKIKVATKKKDLFQGDLSELIVQALLEKKGEDVTIIDLKKINHVYFDKFVIVTGTSKTHVETLCDYVQEVTKHHNAAGAHLVQRLCEEVIVDRLGDPLGVGIINNTLIAERNIA